MSGLDVWVPVFGYESLYEVSSAGDVRRSAPGRGARVGHVLRPHLTAHGYRQVALSKEGEVRSRLVCQLVCESFHGARLEGMEVRHINGSSTDDRAGNLAWGSRLENMQDMARHGTHHNSAKTHCVNGHPLAGDNLGIRPDGGRRCRECTRESSRRLKARRRLAGQAVNA